MMTYLENSQFYVCMTGMQVVNFNKHTYLLQSIVTAHPHAVNCRDLDGRHSTPLHFAAGYNRVALVKFLLDHGADVHAKDKGYVTFNMPIGYWM